MGCLAGFCSSRFLKYGLQRKAAKLGQYLIKIIPAGTQNHLVSLGVLALSGDGDVTERLLVPQMFERSNHIGLEIIPAETELLVTLISRHLENYKGLENTGETLVIFLL